MARTQTSSTPESVEERVLRRIRKASDLEYYARFLLYGRSGSGKTRLSATAPDVLLIDVNEHGTASVRRDLDPNVFPIDRWTDLQDVYWYLASGNHKYKSVALDGITAMQNLCMKFVLGDEASRDASRDPDMPDRRAWGKSGELMKTQITNFRNLPMNVIFTALQRVRTVGEGEENEGDIMISPACSPSVAGHLEAAVDVIGYLTTREVYVKPKDGGPKKRVTRRRLIVGANERYLTKDRTGVFGDVVDSPSITKMLKELKEAA